jgi:hypothetical protein
MRTNAVVGLFDWFALTSIALRTIFTGGVHSLGTGRRLDNELSHGIRPIAADWNRVSYDRTEGSASISQTGCRKVATWLVTYLWDVEAP